MQDAMQQKKNIKTEVLIVGASAAGLMCAIEAAKRSRKVLVIDHANKTGKKILMSGGGRCNFTNRQVSAENFISHNPHFCKSALSRYSEADFIAMVEQYAIAYHERELGKLYCDDSARDILKMLLVECSQHGVDIRLNCEISQVDKIEASAGNAFEVLTSQGKIKTKSLVIASGGLSIPKMGASPFGYKIAEQFGHHIWPTRAGLVPFTLHVDDKNRLAPLSGIALDAVVSNEQIQFKENILFTHRGMSGPGILQISSNWRSGEHIQLRLLPDHDLEALLKSRHQSQPNMKLKTLLSELLPKRVAPILLGEKLVDLRLQVLSEAVIKEIAQKLQAWQIKPNATEGYRTAEVTLGGVDCDELSSKTMQSNRVSGLYFIGEVVDVTGWLGGYNFQWAWSSGWCAGQEV
jgi:predicted Rossmann fold flavoprotein